MAQIRVGGPIAAWAQEEVRGTGDADDVHEGSSERRMMWLECSATPFLAL